MTYRIGSFLVELVPQQVYPIYGVQHRNEQYKIQGHNLQSTTTNINRLFIPTISFTFQTPTALKSLASQHHADVICVQETKLQESAVDEVKCILSTHLPKWRCYFRCSTAKKGYSGVATFCREKPVAVRYGFNSEVKKKDGEDQAGAGEVVDDEGRIVTVEFAR